MSRNKSIIRNSHITTIIRNQTIRKALPPHLGIVLVVKPVGVANFPLKVVQSALLSSHSRYL